ncbi:transposase-like protein [Brevundimonas terrae]|nr:transposase-like protein [Brevundimonas terrae]
MKPLSFKRHLFPVAEIRVEELMAQRGIEVSYETIRCWTIKFWPLIARRLKKIRVPPTGR